MIYVLPKSPTPPAPNERFEERQREAQRPSRLRRMVVIVGVSLLMWATLVVVLYKAFRRH